MTTWYRSTTIRTTASVNSPQGLLAEFNSFFTDCAAESGFGWTVGSYQNTAPFYLVLKRKNGTPGRVMLYGGTGSGPVAAACIGAGSWASDTSWVHVCYDPTATTDTPPGNYTTVNPWSAANSRGRGLAITTNTIIAAHRIRAYTTDDGQLFVHGCIANTGLYYSLHVGPIYRAASGSTTIYEGLAIQPNNSNTVTAYLLEANPSNYSPPVGTSNSVMFGTPDMTAVGNSGATKLGYCSAYIGGAWYQMNRVTGQRFGAQALSDPSNRLHFLPIVWCVTPDSSSVTPSVLKSKNLGAGPCRTLDFVIIDNTAVVRGYYIGYHGTQGTDLTGLSLLNDDI